MEELAEGVLKGVLRLLGSFIRVLLWLVCDFFFEKAAWYIGWPISRVLTLNSLPGERITEADQASGMTKFMVSLTGVISLVALGTCIAQLTG